MFRRVGIFASRIDKNVTLAAQDILEWGKIHEVQIFLGNRLFKTLNGKNYKKGLETCEVIIILGFIFQIPFGLRHGESESPENSQDKSETSQVNMVFD